MVKKGLHHRGQSLWKHKALVCPLITNSTCNPGLRLGDNEPLITEETKRRENSSPRTCLLRAPSTKRTPESSSSSALLLLLPFFLHFILIRLLATLNLLFSRSSKNYHSAKPRKLTWLHLSGGHRCWHSVSFNGSPLLASRPPSFWGSYELLLPAFLTSSHWHAPRLIPWFSFLFHGMLTQYCGLKYPNDSQLYISNLDLNPELIHTSNCLPRNSTGMSNRILNLACPKPNSWPSRQISSSSVFPILVNDTPHFPLLLSPSFMPYQSTNPINSTFKKFPESDHTSSLPNCPLVPTTHYLLSWVLKCPCKQVSRFYSCPTIVFSQNSSQRDAIKTEVKSCHSLIQNLKWLLISLGKTKVLRITAQPCIIRVTPSCSLSSDLIASYSPLAHSPPTTLASICSGCLCLLYLLSGTPSLSIHKLRALTTFTPILKSHLDEAVPHSPF